MIGFVAAVVVFALSGPTTGGATTVAYQGAVSTSARISNAPDLPYGSCVPVRVSITSDAGVPTGTIEFSVDGVVVDRRALPASGSFTEMIGCCGSRISTPLSVGTHHFAVNFIPTGNFAPSHATGQVVIHSVPGGTHPVCGGTPTSGLPHGVDAGLSTFGAHGSGWRFLISGVAIALAATVITTYRRRTRASSR